MTRVADISFLVDIDLRHSVSQKLCYCNTGYNNRKKHKKTGDALDKSKMLSAFNRRQIKHNIHTNTQQKRYKIVNALSGVILKYALENNLIAICNQLQKQGYKIKVELV